MNWRPWAVVGAVLLAMSVSYFAGKNQGARDEILAENKAQTHASDSVTKSVTSKVDSARHTSDTLVIYRERVRAKVVISHDTITVGDSSYVSPDIAQLIVASDSAIAALKNTVALQDTLIGSLRKGISLRDERIKLLESKGSSRFSKGIQAGIGYCATATGNAPCAYLGYGFTLRIP